MLRTWTEKYRDYIDPAYLEDTQGAVSTAAGNENPAATGDGTPAATGDGTPAATGDGSWSVNGQENSGASEDRDGSTGAELKTTSCASDSQTNDTPSTADSPALASEDETTGHERHSDVTTDQLQTGAENSALSGGDEQFSWDDLWQRHYQQVYDEMLAAFTDQWRPETETETETIQRETGQTEMKTEPVRTQRGADAVRSIRQSNGNERMSGDKMEGEGAATSGTGQSTQNHTKAKDGGQKRRNMSSRKAR